MSDSAIPWTAACQVSLSITISLSWLKLMSIELVMPSNHLILCRPLLLLPLVFPSIRVFSNMSALCIRWPNYWSFSFIISPFNEYSGLISFRMDWFDLLAVQGTLKSHILSSSLSSTHPAMDDPCFHFWVCWWQGMALPVSWVMRLSFLAADPFTPSPNSNFVMGNATWLLYQYSKASVANYTQLLKTTQIYLAILKAKISR